MRLIFVFLITTLLLLNPDDLGQASPSNLPLNNNRFFQRIQKQVPALMKKHRIAQSDFGLVIKDLSTGHLDYTLNPDARKIPASLTKILVAGAVLDTFPPHHTFKTQLLLNKDRVEKGALYGPLYLKGFGDPSFTSERMWYLVNEFMRENIQQIKGDILVDDSLFDSIRRENGRLPAQTDRAYDAPVGALSFNWNVINVFLRPGQQRGAGLNVYLDPIASPINLVNRGRTGGKRSTATVKSTPLKATSQNSNQINKVTISGRIPLKSREKVFYRKITHPEIWTGENLKAFLKQRGVIVQGHVKRGLVPSHVKVVASSPGATVTHLVSLMMKHSSNFIAEMLTKQLSLSNGAKVGNLTQGLQVIYSHIESLGLEPKDFRISNVAGLSRRNRFQPTALAKLLKIYHSHFQHSYEFVASLPISGQDGTLKSRMKNANVNGKLRAKSGQINGVIGLAGYVQVKTGDTKVFVAIYNGKKENYQVIPFIDDVMLALAL